LGPGVQKSHAGKIRLSLLYASGDKVNRGGEWKEHKKKETGTMKGGPEVLGGGLYIETNIR